MRLLSRPGWVFAAIGGFCGLLILLIWLRLHRQLQEDRQTAIAAAVQRNSNLAVALEQYAIGTIRYADAELQLIKRTYEQEATHQPLKQLLSKPVFGDVLYEAAGVVTASGNMELAGRGPDGSRNVATENWFQYHASTADTSLHIGKPAWCQLAGKTELPLSRRLSGPNGSFAGVAVVLMEPSVFTRFYAAAALHPHDIISLVTPDGITYSRRTGAVESNGEDISGSPLYTHLKEQPNGNYVAPDAIHHIPTFFSYRRFTAYPIIATAGTAEQDVLLEYNQKSFRDKAAAAIITGLVLLFSAMVYVVLLHRRKTIEWIKESEAKYRSVFENSLDVIVLVKPNGKVVAANKAAAAFFGYPLAEIYARTANQLADVADPEFKKLVEDCTTKGVAQGELKFIRSNGQPVTGEVAGARYNTADGKLRYIIIIRDSTQRIRLQNKLVAEQKRYQRRVTEQVIWAQEREREVIGHELHDNINQVLSTVKLYLEMAIAYKEKREELLPKSIEYLMISINEIRKLSHDLSAPTLGTKSLIDSVTALIETVQSSSGLLIAFDYDEYTHTLPMNQKLALYRITQEQLNNIIKHAKATSVSIKLAQANSETCLTLTDDGQGFNPAAGHNGIGLNNIISRARVFDGRVEIESSPGEGCRLHVCIPFSGDVQPEALNKEEEGDELSKWVSQS